jgi:hypothetical protein
VKSDVADLLAISAGGDIDVIRKGVGLVLQALIDTEVTEAIAAERYERSGERTGVRSWSSSAVRSAPSGLEGHKAGRE